MKALVYRGPNDKAVEDRSHNITITTRLVDTVSSPILLKTVQSKQVNPQLLITHRFISFDQILYAYETFGRAASTKALKVIIAA